MPNVTEIVSHASAAALQLTLIVVVQILKWGKGVSERGVE